MKRVIIYSIILSSNLCFSQMIDAGGHAVLRCYNGDVYTCGYNNSGQLGNGSIVSGNTFTKVLGLSGIIQVGAGVEHTLALDTSGNVWVWGDNDFGQLGDSSYMGKISPFKLSSIDSVVAIEGGWHFSLYLLEDSTVWAVGENTNEQLGAPSPPVSINVPHKISSLSDVIDISAGFDHCLALKADGSVWSWGFNSYGQLGDGSTASSALPVQVQGLNNIVDIAAGWSVSYAIRNDGTLWSWGANYYGQLGIGQTPNHSPSSTPQLVTGLDSVKMIKSNVDFTLALCVDGSVWGWGKNLAGQLGDGTKVKKKNPVKIIGLNRIISIATGTSFGYAINDSGGVFSWGGSLEGSLASDTVTQKLTPSPISPISCNPIISLAEQTVQKPLVEIYPNPVNDFISIESGEGKSIGFVEVFNSTGVSVMKRLNPEKSIDISGLSKGIFFLKIEVDGQFVVKKVLKE